jgi:hypothetical protein
MADGLVVSHIIVVRVRPPIFDKAGHLHVSMIASLKGIRAAYWPSLFRSSDAVLGTTASCRCFVGFAELQTSEPLDWKSMTEPHLSRTPGKLTKGYVQMPSDCCARGQTVLHFAMPEE